MTDHNVVAFDRSIRLGPNFTLGEFLVSRDHPRALVGVILLEWQIQNFKRLVAFGLQPSRTYFKAAHLITSGFRTPLLNQLLVGAVADSQHLRAEAADFAVPGVPILEVFEYWRDELEWPGELLCYPHQARIHAALPAVGVHPDQAVIGGA